jgi:hypothetical protein
MPTLLNPFQSFGTGSTPGFTNAWAEVTRTSTVSAGAISLTGLTLTSYVAVRFVLTGITTGTDDTTVQLRFYVGGSEISTGYTWGGSRGATVLNGFSETRVNNADDAFALTREGTATGNLGNDVTEALHAVVTLFAPTGSLYKLAYVDAGYTQAASASAVSSLVGGRLGNTGAIDGIKLYGSSNLTAGTIIVLGLD